MAMLYDAHEMSLITWRAIIASWLLDDPGVLT